MSEPDGALLDRVESSRAPLKHPTLVVGMNGRERGMQDASARGGSHASGQ
jgi:hypothetical protein